MRRFLTAAALAAALFSPAVLAPSSAAASCYGSTWVDGYIRTDGTYVHGHYRTCPDSSTSNNWSAPGNTNPFTGSGGASSGSTYHPRYSGYERFYP